MVRKKSDSFANIFLEILACIVHNIHGNVIAVNRCCNPCKTCILVSAHNDLANGWSTYSRFVFIILRGFPSKLFYSKFGNCSIFSKLDQIIHFFFSITVFFHGHWPFIGQQGKGGGPSFIPIYHFHPLTNIQTFICNFTREMTITYF